MKLRRALLIPVLALLAGCSSDDEAAGDVRSAEAGPVTASYTGRVLYRGTNAPVADITVEVAGARDDGSPTDDLFGTARSDTQGRFTVASTAPRDQRVTLVAAAVHETAETGGDRRGQGYEIEKHATVLGTLSFPNPAAPNKLFVEPRRPGRGGDDH